MEAAASVSAVLGRATALLANGPSEAARALLEAEFARTPGHAALACRLGDARQLAGALHPAAEAYRAAVAIDPGMAEAWYGLGCARLALKAYGAAAVALERAVGLRPGAGGARYNFGKALFELGCIEAAITQFRRAAADPDPGLREQALRSIACIIPGSPTADHATVLAARRAWVALEAPRLPPVALQSERPAGRRLRIGYASAFFDARNWMKPVFGVINRHDRDRFEVHMISDGGAPSAASGYRDHPADVVHAIRGIGNARAADIIAGAGIDVLVDLNGYSFPDRLGLFMQRPAAVTLGWFNLFATTAIPGFDVLAGDALVIRTSEEAFYTERILRLPGSYLAFEVTYPVPDVAPPPSVATGAVTFGCLGSQYKLTDDVLAAWGAVLAGAPGARLFIKNGTLEDPSCRDHLLRRLLAVGVAAERITLDGRSEHFEFLSAYRHIDIALDTFPYNGGTTTTEALWQGVPVLTFDGDRWASRTSASLLHAAGMADWVAADVDGFVQQAVALARDVSTPARLALLRAGMRRRLAASAACDSETLCRALEGFYVAAVG